jgi:hypothetical protein
MKKLLLNSRNPPTPAISSVSWSSLYTEPDFGMDNRSHSSLAQHAPHLRQSSSRRDLIELGQEREAPPLERGINPPRRRRPLAGDGVASDSELQHGIATTRRHNTWGGRRQQWLRPSNLFPEDDEGSIISIISDYDNMELPPTLKGTNRPRLANTKSPNFDPGVISDALEDEETFNYADPPKGDTYPKTTGQTVSLPKEDAPPKLTRRVPTPTPIHKEPMRRDPARQSRVTAARGHSPLAALGRAEQAPELKPPAPQPKEAPHQILRPHLQPAFSPQEPQRVYRDCSGRYQLVPRDCHVGPSGYISTWIAGQQMPQRPPQQVEGAYNMTALNKALPGPRTGTTEQLRTQKRCKSSRDRDHRKSRASASSSGVQAPTSEGACEKS